MTLADALREARDRSGMSLRDVERATGIRSGHLSQLETGTIARPEVALLWDLAGLYGLDFEELVRLAGHELAGGNTLAVAFRALTDLSPDEQLEAIRFMARLKQG